MSCCTPEPARTAPVKPGVALTPQLIALVVAGFIAGNSTLVALVANLSERTGAAQFAFQTGLLVATMLVILLLAPQLVRGVLANIRRRRLSVDLLFLLGCVGAMTFSMITYLRGQGPVYFEVVSILLFIYCLGSWVKGATQRRIWSSLDAWSPDSHQCQLLDEQGHLRWVPVKEIAIDDRVLVPAGAMVPVDGTVAAGEAFLQTSTITGEPHVRAAGPGESVFASSVAVDAPLEITATQAGDERLIDRVGAVVRNAALNPSRWETQADRVASWFTPLVASLALVTLAGWWLVSSFDQAILTSMAVLLVACPCAFGFATPVSIWVTLSRLATCSLLVQKNDVIERLASVDTVVFDKTGTLTVIQPRLLEVHRVPGSRWSQDELLLLARSLEASSHHPIAAAFLQDSAEPGHHGDRKVLPVRQLKLLPASGVQGTIEFQSAMLTVSIERWDSLRWECPPHLADVVSRSQQQGNFLVVVTVDAEVAGMMVVGESPIDTLASGLAKLSEMGLDVKLLSGDAGIRVEQLPISDAEGGLTPTDKAQRVKELKSSGRQVLFVGDGTNDAAAMSHAAASISTADGSALAHETADLVWYGHDLNVIAEGIEICRRSVVRLRRALLFAIAYNSFGIALAASGWLHPVAAVVLMMASSLTVVLHAADMNWERSNRSGTPLQPRKAEPPSAPRDLVQLG